MAAWADDQRPRMTLAEALEKGATVFALLECRVYAVDVPGEPVVDELGAGERRMEDGEVRYSSAWL